MLQLLLGLPGLISGAFGTINGITSAIANEKLAVITAGTEKERIGAQERVSTLEARRDVLIADASHGSIDIWIRALCAIGPAGYLVKIFLWDKVVGSIVGCVGRTEPGTCTSYTTDPLDPNLWQVVMVVLGFYFLSETAVKVTRIIKAN